MADFRCRLATASGEILERDYSAPDAPSLRRDLERQDLLVLSIESRSPLAGAVTGLLRRRRHIPVADFLVFNQEFTALVRAGLPIVESLSLLLERRKNPVFRAALVDVRDRVRNGESLSDAFAAQPALPPLYASTLASGERSGEIATVLTRYIKYVTIIQNVRRKVLAALIYPAVLVVIATIITLVLLTWVLPRFQDFFAGFGTDLPLITQVVLAASNALRTYWLLWIGALAGAVLLFAVWRRTPGGRRAVERFSYRIPLVGRIRQEFVVSRFTRTLSTLIAGGIPVVSCLEIIARAIGTPLYEAATQHVAGRIREGAGLASSLEETGLFPDLALEMVRVGESSGSLAEMLEFVADFIDQEIETRLQRLMALVEPALLVFMALIVATLLLAIYYPMLQVYSAGGGGGI